MKKLLSLVVSLMLVIGMVGCNSSDTDKDNNTKQDQQTFKEEVITNNEYVKMTLVDKGMDEYNSIARLKVLIENKTDKDLIVYTENWQVNGIMNDPCWTCSVNANSKAYSFVEWIIDYEGNPNVKSDKNLVNILGDIYLTGDDYNEIYREQIAILYNGKTKEVEENEKANEDKEEKISNNNQLTQTSKKSTSTLSNESDNNSNTNQSVNSSNKTTSNTKKHSNNTNNSNSNTNNNSTCDFCGSATNTVQTYGNYRLCHSCYQGVVNSAEGDHKLYEEDDDNYYQSDQDYEEDVEYYEDGGVKDGTALGEHPWNQDDYNEEDA